MPGPVFQANGIVSERDGSHPCIATFSSFLAARGKMTRQAFSANLTF